MGLARRKKLKKTLWAYAAVADPITTKLPVYESLASLEQYVDGFAIADFSIYDKVDLSEFNVKRYTKSVYPPFDDPFGAIFTAAMKLVPPSVDYVMFVDLDEIYEFKGVSLKEIMSRYPLDSTGAGISFALRNYYCSRNFTIGGPSSKGPTIFKNRPDLFHDMIAGMVQPLSSIRRVSSGFDHQDGVRLVNGEGRPLAQWEPISFDECVVHHTSHLDPVSKMIRSVLQFAHTSTLDLPNFFPFDPRLRKEAVDMIYEKGLADLKDKSFELYGEPVPFDYEPNELLDAFIERADIYEVDPRDYPLIEDPFKGNETPGGGPSNNNQE